MEETEESQILDEATEMSQEIFDEIELNEETIYLFFFFLILKNVKVKIFFMEEKLSSEETDNYAFLI